LFFSTKTARASTATFISTGGRPTFRRNASRSASLIGRLMGASWASPAIRAAGAVSEPALLMLTVTPG
jgi:hypothetical protein